MTRFLFITDTHIGANPVGFHQQPSYPEHIAELLDGIKRIIQEGEIDFVVHGGDMVDHCCKESIEEAKRLFDFPVPVYLSLGNHDLDREDALQIWLKQAPGFFAGGNSPQYSIRSGSCRVHVVPNQWERDAEYVWRNAQEPYLTPGQLRRIDQELQIDPEGFHILVIHNPIYGVSTEQTGLERVVHDVPAPFRECVLELMRAYPQVKCVLSGHNHINTMAQTEEGIFVSGSSFVETPFEYKLIEVTDDGIRLQTFPLSGPLSFEPKYDISRSFVQGREQDREAVRRFRN